MLENLASLDPAAANILAELHGQREYRAMQVAALSARDDESARSVLGEPIQLQAASDEDYRGIRATVSFRIQLPNHSSTWESVDAETLELFGRYLSPCPFLR